jgi:hypothetical protein
LLAGTLVLRERSGLQAPAPVSFDVPAGLEPFAATLDVSGLTTEQYQAVRAFLLRTPSLPPQPRASLALQLASPLAERLRPPPPPGVAPELYLRCVAAAYQRRQRPGDPGLTRDAEQGAAWSTWSAARPGSGWSGARAPEPPGATPGMGGDAPRGTAPEPPGATPGAGGGEPELGRDGKGTTVAPPVGGLWDGGEGFAPPG